jgi:hydroxymethylbilane synthase
MIIIGSRGSQLALWQAHWIEARLQALGAETRLEIIRTTGDKITDVPLAKVGAKGLFTKEIEEALLDGRIDVAVHSLKDLPTEVPAGLTVSAIPEREDARDAVLGKKIADLPQGAQVGTSSLRRSAQLLALRPDLQIESVRGNLDTRIRKLDEGQYESILLAAAGLNRLGWEGRIAEILDPGTMVPAVGQGALAVETRDDDGAAQRLVRQLDHAPTRQAVMAERALLAALGGGCQVPIGAHAVQIDGSLRLTSLVIDPLGKTRVVHQASGHDPEALGRESAQALLENGAREILAQVYGLQGLRVVVTRAKDQSAELSAKLSALGAEVIELPTIELRPPEDPAPLDRAIHELDRYDWILFTSANGVKFFADRVKHLGLSLDHLHARICAIGTGTAAAATERGLNIHLMPDAYVAESVVLAFMQFDLNGKRILLPRARIARDLIPLELLKRGALVDVVEAYRNVIPKDLSLRAIEVLSAKPDWLTLTSASTVKNLLSAAPRELLEPIKLASIGPITTEAALRHGLTVTVEASPHTLDALVLSLTQK